MKSGLRLVLLALLVPLGVLGLLLGPQETEVRLAGLLGLMLGLMLGVLGLMLEPSGLLARLARVLLAKLTRVMKGTSEKSTDKPPKIHAAPGSSWLKFIDFYYSSKFVKGVTEPIIADWQHEYFEALNQKRKWKARWICVRYNWAMIKTLWLVKAWDMLEKVFGLVAKK